MRLLVLIVACLASPAFSNGMTANDYLALCNDVEPKSDLQNWCAGVVLGFQQGAVISNIVTLNSVGAIEGWDKSEQQTLGFCVPDFIPPVQMMETTILFIKNNPKIAPMPFGIAMWRAFNQAYPCD